MEHHVYLLHMECVPQCRIPFPRCYHAYLSHMECVPQCMIPFPWCAIISHGTFCQQLHSHRAPTQMQRAVNSATIQRGSRAQEGDRHAHLAVEDVQGQTQHTACVRYLSCVVKQSCGDIGRVKSRRVTVKMWLSF
jgi:hypothetical protein